jgi:hypothetical protein
MSEEHPKHDLELTEDLRFEGHEWTVQRIAWFIMAVLILLGILGFFGAGPISSRSVTSSDGTVKLEYKRFERFQAPSTLRVVLHPSGPPAARLWISQQFLETIKVESIVPSPEQTEVRDGGTVYSFRVSRHEAISIMFHLQIQNIGSSPIRVRGDEGAILEAAHWVYP